MTTSSRVFVSASGVKVARALLLEGKADHAKVDDKGRSAKQAARDMYFYRCEEAMTVSHTRPLPARPALM